MTGEADVRVPPAWTRPFMLVLVVLVAAYQVEGTLLAVSPGSIPRAVHLPHAYLASWDMFSGVGGKHRILEVQGVYGGVPERLDVERLFPTRWESGLRFERSALYHSPKMRRVAAAICGRAAKASPARAPEAVILSEVSWPRKAGRKAGRPGAKAEREEILTYRCDSR